MFAKGPALLVIASLATVADVPAAAAQQTSSAAEQQQARDPQATEAQEPERASGRKRTGLKGWFRQRLEAPPKPVTDPGGGFSPTAGTVVSGSGLAVGGKYKSVNLLPGGIDAQVSGMVSLRGYQEYSAAIGWMDRDRSTVALDTAVPPGPVQLIIKVLSSADGATAAVPAVGRSPLQAPDPVH